MDTSGQIPEAGELRPDQLEIGKKYRIVEYGRPSSKVPHKVLGQSLAMFKGPHAFHYMKFTIVAPLSRRGQVIDALMIANSPAHNYYNRYFQTAQDRIVAQFEQRALQSVFEQRLDKASAYGLTKNWLGPSEKPRTESGGRKYKTRQTKMRRHKNKTKKNHKRTRRMRH
jgi:hypothetical protein